MNNNKIIIKRNDNKIFDNKKKIVQEFQDRSIKITKSTERLVSSGHFAGEQATEQAYAILGAAADYVNDLDQYESLLNRAVAFFNSARSVSIDLLTLALLDARVIQFNKKEILYFYSELKQNREEQRIFIQKNLVCFIRN